MFLFSSYFREDLPCGMKLNCAHFPVRYRRRFFESRGKGVSAWQNMANSIFCTKREF